MFFNSSRLHGIGGGSVVPSSHLVPLATIALLLQPSGIVLHRECNPLKVYMVILDWEGCVLLSQFVVGQLGWPPGSDGAWTCVPHLSEPPTDSHNS